MIDLENIKKAYSGNVILKNINLHVSSPTVFALVGPNGSGKSTLLKMILGLVIPDSGRVSFEDTEVNDVNKAVRKQIGYMPQVPSFPRNLKVREIIGFLDSLNGGEAPHHDRLMQDLEISAFYDRYFGDLSGGMKQKVNILQCFRSDKKLYVLDEPTVSLDPHMAYYLKSLVRERNQAGHSFIFTSHIMHEVEDMADEMALLLEGEIRIAKKLADLKNEFGGLPLEESLRQYWSSLKY